MLDYRSYSHAVDVVSLIGKGHGVIDSHFVEFGEFEGVVDLEIVGGNKAVRSDYLFNDPEQFFGSFIRHDGRKTLAAPFNQADSISF